MSLEFHLGQIIMTREVNNKTAFDASFSKFVQESIVRHSKGDWGDISKEDKRTNASALKTGERLHSAYEKDPFPKIWVITGADRSVTDVMFPEDY